MTCPADGGSRRYQPHPEDIDSPDAIVGALYRLISGPAGPRNWPRLRSLFLDGARLIPVGRRIHGADGSTVTNR